MNILEYSVKFQQKLAWKFFPFKQITKESVQEIKQFSEEKWKY